MLEIGLAHYLTLAAILLTLGVFGIFLNNISNWSSIIDLHKKTHKHRPVPEVCCVSRDSISTQSYPIGLITSRSYIPTQAG